MIKVFIGCAANHEDAESQAVVEYSLRKYSSEPLDITWMKLSADPNSFFYSKGSEGWQTGRWATPFSGFRWAVPHLCGFQGKAVYTDSDVIFLADVAELYSQDVKYILGKGGGAWRLCVSLWNCEACREILPPIKQIKRNASFHQQMSQRAVGFVQPFKGDWNNLDGKGFPQRMPKALHYTNMRTQPQLRYAIPRLKEQGREHWFDGQLKEHQNPAVVSLFDRYFHESQEAGYTLDRYTQDPLYGQYRKRSFK